MKYMGWLIEALSQPGTEPGKARLVTLGFSHFNEKARWAIDLSPLRDSYTEDCHPPGLHTLVTKKLSKDGKTSTPLLCLPPSPSPSPPPSPPPSPEVYQDSTDIITYLVRRYPEEAGFLIPKGREQEVLSLIAEFDRTIGQASRLWAYAYLLDNPEMTKKVFIKNVSTIEAFLMGKAYPQVVRVVRRSLKITDKTAAEAEQVCKEAFEKVSSLLADGRQYLLGGDRITAADITFAALAYSIVAPPELNSVSIAYEELPSEMQEVVDRFRVTRAGQYVLRLYQQDRHVQRPLGWPVRVKNGNSGREGQLLSRLLRVLLPALLVLIVAYSLSS